ncbi:MAG: efflux transporter outer membrane subunit, partial [Parahaliea sp.]
PYLSALITRSIEGNNDLLIAVARIDEAGAALGQVRAAKLPTVSLGGNVTERGARNPMTDSLETEGQYGVSGELGWEIDIWGKLEKGVSARKAAYRASEADWRATYLTTVSRVATTYFLIRSLDEQIDLQQQSLAAGERIYQIYRNQYAEKLVANTPVLRQQAELNNLKRRLLDLQRERKIAENALATLLGQPAGSVGIPTAPLRNTVSLMDIPGGLPSELLSRRPDIVAAEYRVLEAYELVGEAELARLPSISLTASTQGGGNLVSASLSTLVKSLTFGIGPSINIPIFDPKLKARVKSREASARVVEEQYRKTVIQAFQEVENALVNLDSRQLQQRELEQEVANLQRVARQTRAQLEVGIVTQLEVLESERRLLNTHQTLLGNHQQILGETVELYKAMGGGWSEEVVRQAGP